jgi:glycerol kinase
VELCEASNAGRTLLCRLGSEDWDDDLLELFGVPRELLPPIVDSDAIGQATGDAASGVGPVTAMLGDQQASLFGLGCRAPGMAKVTLGTGAFILAQAGATPPTAPGGVLSSCAWRREGQTSFALEGFIPTAGAALSWLSEIGVLSDPAGLDELLGSAGPDDGAAVCVPALQGLGTPSWDASARGAILGISRATTRGELARAVVDGVLHQVADALEAISAQMPIETVLLDGGVSRSDWATQRLADIAGVSVTRAARGEATAIGAAMVAGLAAGFWGGVEDFPPLARDLTAEPSWSRSERERRRERWRAAVELSTSWA